MHDDRGLSGKYLQTNSFFVVVVKSVHVRVYFSDSSSSSETDTTLFLDLGYTYSYIASYIQYVRGVVVSYHTDSIYVRSSFSFFLTITFLQILTMVSSPSLSSHEI